jgi:hypothetical protein
MFKIPTVVYSIFIFLYLSHEMLCNYVILTYKSSCVVQILIIAHMWQVIWLYGDTAVKNVVILISVAASNA